MKKTLGLVLAFVSVVLFTYGCGSSGGGDSTAPTVLSVTPLSSATAVMANTTVTVTFDEEMDPATVTTSSFTLADALGAVTGTVSASSDKKTFTLTPTANLSTLTAYTATVTTAVKDSSGNALAANYTWTFTTDVIKGDLVTSLILNGKSDSQPVQFGDMLRYAITYKNSGTAVLGNVSLAVTLDTTPASGVLDWSKLSDKAGGVQNGDALTWTKKEIPSLAQINPGDGGTIDFEIPFLAKPISGVLDGDFEVSALVAATIDTVDGTQVGRVAKTAPVVAKAVSDAQLTAEARYFNPDDIPVGSGPLPPQVGQKTSYRVTMTITNSLHELTDLRLSAALPPNVIWTGVSTVDAGNLTFDAANDKMVWTLNRMPLMVPTLNVSFDAAITPSKDQQGTFATLIDGVIFEATDLQNGFPILLAASPLTTSLDSDPNAAGKGRVQ